eukprot:Gregarina_sp_Poly_1__10818@NODE_834_length_6076_cov_122_476286_g602_i0_p2_GENE_NODE_834_length_6076_cov_122_476286_g602_i0NODE_834_length_6076_cov_122_476286_g602_i0_p2_ORF_typecomplete_len540_score56_86_NODE_834_length_6076_cov_122_476286_g602_i034595078
MRHVRIVEFSEWRLERCLWVTAAVMRSKAPALQHWDKVVFHLKENQKKAALVQWIEAPSAFLCASRSKKNPKFHYKHEKDSVPPLDLKSARAPFRSGPFVIPRLEQWNLNPLDFNCDGIHYTIGDGYQGVDGLICAVNESVGKGSFGEAFCSTEKLLRWVTSEEGLQWLSEVGVQLEAPSKDTGQNSILKRVDSPTKPDEAYKNKSIVLNTVNSSLIRCIRKFGISGPTVQAVPAELLEGMALAETYFHSTERVNQVGRIVQRWLVPKSSGSQISFQASKENSEKDEIIEKLSTLDCFQNTLLKETLYEAYNDCMRKMTQVINNRHGLPLGLLKIFLHQMSQKTQSELPGANFLNGVILGALKVHVKRAMEHLVTTLQSQSTIAPESRLGLFIRLCHMTHKSYLVAQMISRACGCMVILRSSPKNALYVFPNSIKGQGVPTIEDDTKLAYLVWRFDHLDPAYHSVRLDGDIQTSGSGYFQTGTRLKRLALQVPKTLQVLSMDRRMWLDREDINNETMESWGGFNLKGNFTARCNFLYGP